MNMFLAFISSSIPLGVPLLYGSTGEIITEKSGHLNLGIPGIMYVGSIGGVIGAFFYEMACDAAGRDLVPFLAIMAMLTDIIGSDGDFWQQIIYLVPTISLLSIAVSVTLRRRGYSKSGFIVQLIGPAIFIIIYFLSLI